MEGELLGLRCEVLEVSGESQQEDRRSAEPPPEPAAQGISVTSGCRNHDPQVALRSHLHTACPSGEARSRRKTEELGKNTAPLQAHTSAAGGGVGA